MPASDIVVKGAREHNLRGVDLVLPRNKLVCLTGVSGSGKSSLAFDTLYAEGQRRYVESLSTFARQFLGQMPKPDVEHISGLSPSISISQKSSGQNPRSTVGTVTEIYDYLRVLYARTGQGHCPKCSRPITAQSREQIIERIMGLPDGTQFLVLAPLIRAQKGEYRDLFVDLREARVFAGTGGWPRRAACRRSAARSADAASYRSGGRSARGIERRAVAAGRSGGIGAAAGARQSDCGDARSRQAAQPDEEQPSDGESRKSRRQSPPAPTSFSRPIMPARIAA